MLYVIIGTGLLFVAIGFTVTENNAKYLLSGYNMMSEEDRKKVDIGAYITYFRNFHILLGLSLLLFGAAFTLISEKVSALFITFYPIVAYIYFISTSSKYYKGQSKKWNSIGIAILFVALLFFVGLLGYYML